MTSEDVMKWCERGNHDFKIVDVAMSHGHSGCTYLIYKCTNCPARKVSDL